MASGISKEVEQFIYDNINSVEQLEVLLLLAAEPQREWSAARVSQELRIQPESAANRLADLHSRGILDSKPEAEPQYSYKPRTKALQDAVSGLVRTYKERRVAVISLIFSKPTDNVRVFADAFRLKKED